MLRQWINYIYLYYFFILLYVSICVYDIILCTIDPDNKSITFYYKKWDLSLTGTMRSSGVVTTLICNINTSELKHHSK